MVRAKLLFVLLILTSTLLHAKQATPEQKKLCSAIVNAAHKFPDAGQEKQFRSILKITRCVKCPNQSLESSQAGLANDLRVRICLSVLGNLTNQQIIDDLVQHYGDYILYDPRFTPSNYLLWLAPVVLLLFGLVILFINIKAKAQAKEAIDRIDPDQARKLEKLLAKNDEEHGT